ncbi:LAGLIDADG family homing endonuclease [Priestia megaterium]
MPSEYLRHFVRGYFDGNGHFSLENSKRDGVRYSSGFTLGSKTLAEELRDVLHEMGLTKVKVYYRDRRGTSGRGEYYEFRYYQADTQKLSDLIYKDATIFMERKRIDMENVYVPRLIKLWFFYLCQKSGRDAGVFY